MSHFWEESVKQLLFPMTMEVYCKHQKPHQDALSPTTPVENRRTVGILMGFLEVLAGVTKIEVDPYHPLGSLEPSETPSGCSCPPQLQLGSRRTGGVLMGPQDSFFKSNFLTRVCVGNNSFYFQVDGNLCSSASSPPSTYLSASIGKS